MTKVDKTGLTERQIKAVPFLIAAQSEVEGCRTAKISRQTYYEWLKEPLFKAELHRAREIILTEAIEALKNHATHAVNTLVKLLNAEMPSLQRSVANDILNHIMKFKELQELETRLDNLECKSSSKP